MSHFHCLAFRGDLQRDEAFCNAVHSAHTRLVRGPVRTRRPVKGRAKGPRFVKQPRQCDFNQHIIAAQGDVHLHMLDTFSAEHPFNSDGNADNPPELLDAVDNICSLGPSWYCYGEGLYRTTGSLSTGAPCCLAPRIWRPRTDEFLRHSHSILWLLLETRGRANFSSSPWRVTILACSVPCLTLTDESLSSLCPCAGVCYLYAPLISSTITLCVSQISLAALASVRLLAFTRLLACL